MSRKTVDEKELILQSQQGNGNAFEALVYPHKAKIFAHIVSLVKDANSAEDVMQEAMIAAYQHIQDFRQQSSFATWFWRIAHNKGISWLRKEKSGKMQELHEELHSAKEKEDTSIYEEILPLLPEKQRECYRLYVMEAMPQKEIAEFLGIPLGTVRSRIHYARKRIRTSLR